jgi:hypothetical protein
MRRIASIAAATAVAFLSLARAARGTPVAAGWPAPAPMAG